MKHSYLFASLQHNPCSNRSVASQAGRPLYKLQSLPLTPVSILEKAREVALSSGLEYVYIGNVPGHEGENTFCPKCKKLLIQRTGYMVGEVHLKGGKCGYCGKPIPGIWA